MTDSSLSRPSAATAFPIAAGSARLLTEPVPPEARFASLADRRTVPDQWQVQVQARVQTHARVAVHCDGVSDADLALAHLAAAPDITAAVAAELARIGLGATCCVLPEGPQTISYPRESQADP